MNLNKRGWRTFLLLLPVGMLLASYAIHRYNELNKHMAQIKRAYAKTLDGKELLVAGLSCEDISPDERSLWLCKIVSRDGPHGKTIPITMLSSAGHPTFTKLTTLFGHSEIRVIRVSARESPAGDPAVLGSWLEALPVAPQEPPPAPTGNTISPGITTGEITLPPILAGPTSIL